MVAVVERGEFCGFLRTVLFFFFFFFFFFFLLTIKLRFDCKIKFKKVLWLYTGLLSFNFKLSFRFLFHPFCLGAFVVGVDFGDLEANLFFTVLFI